MRPRRTGSVSTDKSGAYVKDDVRVRDAVLEALLNDSNQGLRTQALHLLDPVRADGSVRAVLEKFIESTRMAKGRPLPVVCTRSCVPVSFVADVVISVAPKPPVKRARLLGGG